MHVTGSLPLSQQTVNTARDAPDAERDGRMRHNLDMGQVVTGGATVLVVEDEDSIRAALCELLRHAREFDLLAFLASSPRQVFSRDQLLEQVWGSSADWQQQATVTEHVHRLRQKVGSDRIATVRGVGYRFEPGTPAHVAE